MYDARNRTRDKDNSTLILIDIAALEMMSLIETFPVAMSWLVIILLVRILIVQVDTP